MRSRFAVQSRHWIFLFLVFGAGFILYRAPAAQSVEGLPPAIIIVEGKTPQGFPYLSGGVSTDERELMRQRAKSYNVRLSFAEKRGTYLSDVTLVIEGPKGTEIINTVTNGPWFYIQLPAGGYAVKATFAGQAKELKDLNVPKEKAVQATLVWDLGEQ